MEWGSDHLDLAIPLVVEVSYIDGEYVATHDATKVFGHGATPADALSDFNSAFLTSYHIVSKFGPGNFSRAPIMHHVRGYIGQQA